jgi:hypothetical protein
LVHAGVSDPLVSEFLLRRGDQDGFLDHTELVQAQKDGLITIDQDGKIAATDKAVREAKADRAARFDQGAMLAIEHNEGTGVNEAPYNNDNKIGIHELAHAGVTDPLVSEYLRRRGDADGFLDHQELIQAQDDGLITIDQAGKITATDKAFHDAKVDQDARFYQGATNAIRQNEGTGVNQAPYNNDNKIGMHELAHAGVTDATVSEYLRRRGDADGFLDHKELVQAQYDGLIMISPDGKIAATDKAVAMSKVWAAEKPADPNEGFVSNGRELMVDIKASTTVFNNKIFFTTGDDTTRHYVGDNRNLGSVSIGSFPPGTMLKFGIESGQGDTYFQGDAQRNVDGKQHSKVGVGADGSHNIGFEDLRGGGDNDFDDVVIQVREAPPKKPADPNEGFVSTGGKITVDIKASSSGYDNKIFYTAGDDPTRHYIGVDNHLAAVSIGTFLPGTLIKFGIDNGQGDIFVQGDAKRNADGIKHANVSVNADGSHDIGFEDLRGGGDNDFNDAVIRVTSDAART